MYEEINDIDINSKISKIRKSVKDWYSYWSSNNQYYRQKMQFLQGDQWDSGTANYFAMAKIPTMTINLCYIYAKQLISELIQNLPDLQVIPKNMYVPDDTIELFQDLIRTSMVNSGGEDQLKQCAKQILCGFSAIHTGTRYDEPSSFQEETFFEIVNDPTCCGWSPSAEKKCKQDSDYCFRMRFLTKDEWKREFPDIEFKVTSFSGFDFSQSNQYATGMKSIEMSVVCEFYEKEYKNAKYIKVSPTIDGSPFAEMEEKDFDAYLEQFLQVTQQKRMQSEAMGQEYMSPPVPMIVDRKKDKKYKIKCYMCREDLILDEYDWKSKELPIVYVDGDSWELDGKQRVKSLTHEAEDLQRALNYQWTFLIQFMKTSMKGKVFATPGQMDGFEYIYKNPELYSGAIPYNWIQAVGQPPTVIDAPQLKQEMLLAIQQTTQSLMQVLGKNSQDSQSKSMISGPLSGEAYQKMIMQQNQASYIQQNNLFDAVKQVGMVFIDLYPKIYTDLQSVTLYDKDMQPNQTQLNGTNQETQQPENEVVPIKAAINISASASFAMQKQIERDFLLQVLSAGASNPELFSLVADQFAQLSETSITPTIVRRLKTIVPPNVLAADDGKNVPPPPPQPNPEIQLKQQELQLKAQQMQQDMQRSQMELSSKMAQIKQDHFNSLIEIQKDGIKSNAEIRKAQIDYVDHMAELRHNETMRSSEQSHQAGMQHMKTMHEVVKQKAAAKKEAINQ